MRSRRRTRVSAVSFAPCILASSSARAVQAFSQARLVSMTRATSAGLPMSYARQFVAVPAVILADGETVEPVFAGYEDDTGVNPGAGKPRPRLRVRVAESTYCARRRGSQRSCFIADRIRPAQRLSTAWS